MHFMVYLWNSLTKVICSTWQIPAMWRCLLDRDGPVAPGYLNVFGDLVPFLAQIRHLHPHPHPDLLGQTGQVPAGYLPMYWQRGSLYLLAGKQVSASLASRQTACQAGSSLLGN
ncbi:hypothetical protein PCANC_04049 [Puccinia coronata f. sp. avenae]|uniref:Uncharacterized protein n=1 Tax=Puccinia coronata f. sp. avenae TaxID=200324 RepID=A0A2N5W2B5_9BASI|nr:hypothetical protein PCANC_04049 [Puccinia coronata f. sp. avenae]